MSFPRRGEVYSNDVVVIPGTTQKKDTVYPIEILVTEGFSKPTKFQADSIFTIGKEELGEKITELSPDIMLDVNTALQIELNLE